MTTVTMSKFADFVARSGATRLTAVRRDKKQQAEGYSVATDYWLPLRQRVRRMHLDGSDPDDLNGLVTTVHPKKQGNYEACVVALQKWMAPLTFQDAKAGSTKTYMAGPLEVKVTPDIVVTFDGVRTVLKHHYNSAPLTRLQRDVMLHIMRRAWPNIDQVAILDVRRGALHTATAPKRGYDTLLIGEGAAFAAMWASI